MKLPNQFGKVVADAEAHLKKLDAFDKESGIDNMLKIREYMIEAGDGHLLPSMKGKKIPKKAKDVAKKFRFIDEKNPLRFIK